MKIALGLIIALLIGIAARYFDIPSPAPPKLLGVALVVMMTIGYVATDYVMKRNQSDSAGAVEEQVEESKPSH